LGATDQSVDDGAASPSSPLAHTNASVTVSIGGKDAGVQFAGLVPGYVGLYQINALVPVGVSPGNAVGLSISVAGQTGPSAPIAIQ
jgi:adhesin/invasin